MVELVLSLNKSYDSYAKFHYLSSFERGSETFNADLNVKHVKQYEKFILNLMLNNLILVSPSPKDDYRGKAVLNLLIKIELLYNQGMVFLNVKFPIVVT